MFDTVLVANRGEIAVRVIRTLRAWASGRSPSTATPTLTRDTCAKPTRGPAGTRGGARSYLDIDKVLDAAARTGAQAIHPGYGFLSENAHFAAACERAGVVFLGPPAGAGDGYVAARPASTYC